MQNAKLLNTKILKYEKTFGFTYLGEIDLKGKYRDAKILMYEKTFLKTYLVESDLTRK